MQVVTNTAKIRLQQGALSLGLGLRQARTVDICDIARTCGFDWIFIDMEHGSMDLDTVAQFCSAALNTGVTPIVRVPGHEHYHATRALDAGALGIVVPHVDTPAAAMQVARNCRFPPKGKRSVPGMLPQVRFQQMPIVQMLMDVNAATLVVAMLETVEAIENAEAIAAVDGIDILLVGGGDLATDLGTPGDFTSVRFSRSVARVIEVCRIHAKFPGLAGVYDHESMRIFIEMGARFILGGSDLNLMIAGAQQRTSFLHSLLAAPPVLKADGFAGSTQTASAS
jgi:2-keto-3-deoxy-L-rhamnonate aldolase RhmA